MFDSYLKNAAKHIRQTKNFGYDKYGRKMNEFLSNYTGFNEKQE